MSVVALARMVKLSHALFALPFAASAVVLVSRDASLDPLRLALVAAGIPLAVGTDSLASCPSLAPLADVAVLWRAFPSIPASRLLPLAWNGPAVAAPHVGALPGVLSAPARLKRVEDPFELVIAFGAEEKPFEWLARARHPSVGRGAGPAPAPSRPERTVA